ncbi:MULTISPECIES: glycerol-3-phosphate dehydrogenase [Agrobacterium]|uniref:Glycerol-3-phosphate dehydrogenase n=1 Tax=Agrobacterium rosae TaxID=1972867 RepID=A0A1R3TI57_9HYPH|nr:MULTISPECIES: glycerol-3-phosphate dehydrogenase [Agrobacterium]SCX09534.1 Aerobic glycerol-3-phosphate dehydrogenase [Agrobacterium rosae]SCX25807.1 Aerobic glycerol-3-phosphate dehydrogenase [Agrobacterium sp. DSM 25558]
MTEQAVRDIFVIGGGINGCGIARDAAGRGYSVTLAEMNDFASGTSSGATKLIHGGLRYLEHYEFRLVREALMEREVLWAMAPHIIWPMRFVLPFHKGGIRPAWLIRLGLFLYDHLGGRKLLPATKSLDMRRDPAGKPLKPLFTKAFEYSDGWVDDARLVVLNARDAADRGADIMSRAKVTSVRREGGLWNVDVQDTASGTVKTVKSRMLVNASGPWVDNVLSNAAGKNQVHNVRLVQGSHIIVKKKFNDPRAYFFQNPDNRIIFAIPYETDFTLIGTTDRDYQGDPADVKISGEETDYLCNAASEYFAEPVTKDDIVWTYSAVRPLFDDGASSAQEATRDYVLKLENASGEAPLLNVFGGKLTTYRRLAEHALEKVAEAIGDKGKPWTGKSSLPGGDFAATGYETEVKKLSAKYSFLSERQARRLVRLYGTKANAILGDATGMKALGQHFGGDLYEREVEWLIRQEWARTSDDVLWRRTKQGLHFSKEEAVALDTYMASIAA